MLTRGELLRFLRQHRLAVVATTHDDGAPQAAVVGVAFSDELELIFDTLADTRKLRNLRRDPRAAAVVGWDREATAQIEGTADFPQGAELERIRRCYFEVYPDGRERLSWPGLTHVRIRPTWVRHSDFSSQPPAIAELDPDQLRAD